MIMEQTSAARPDIASSASQAVLNIENLSIDLTSRTGVLKAVTDVNLKLFSGETLALVGESGSGKSLTSLSVPQLLPSALSTSAGSRIHFRRRSGEVVDLAAAKPDTLRSVRGGDLGIIFQEPLASLNPVLSIGEQIAEPIMAHMGLSRRAAWARAEELLSHVEIPEARRRAKQYPHEFSGGMAQRATIAMALACDPAMLIADEPTTALDVTTQAQILDLMQGLQRESAMAMLFVTHNFAVVAQVAHRVAVMYSGYVVEHGSVRDVFAHPKHPYTLGLLGCIAQEGEVLKLRRENQPLPSIEGSVPTIAKRPAGCPFAPRCSFAVAACTKEVPALEATDTGTASRCIRWRDI
jgi:peptide/nickel transport system ATP-binding protein